MLSFRPGLRKHGGYCLCITSNEPQVALCSSLAGKEALPAGTCPAHPSIVVQAPGHSARREVKIRTFDSTPAETAQTSPGSLWSAPLEGVINVLGPYLRSSIYASGSWASKDLTPWGWGMYPSFLPLPTVPSSN